MALTKDFKETVQARAKRDPAFRQALLQEGLATMLEGDLETGQAKVDHRPCGAGGRYDAYVCRLLPLTCLAPDIVEGILDGRQPKGLKLAEMLGNGPVAWTPRGRLGASAIDTKLLREVRSRAAQLVLTLKQTAGQRESEPACPVYARKHPCWRVTWDGRV